MGAFESKNKNPNTVGKRQTVPIGVDDPRLKPNKKGQTYARQGAEIEEIGLDGKTLIGGGRTLNNPAGIVSTTPRLPEPADIVFPPINNQPPQVYPGGSGPVIIVPTDPTNVVATWSENSLIITFDWDYSNTTNSTVSQFIVQLTSGGVTKRTSTNSFIPNKTQTLQTITVTESIITSIFNRFTTNFSSICVLTADPLNNISNTICAAVVPTYSLNLNAPTVLVANANNGYIVTVTNTAELAKSSFDAIDIWEIESTAASAPTIIYNPDGVTPLNYSRVYFNKINPAIIVSPNLNKRWVVIRFSSIGGTYTAFSTAYQATPVSTISLDNIPPNEITAVTASWSVDNVIINYTQPALDPGSRYLAILTAPNSSVGYFYFYPTGATPLAQIATITKNDIFNQFGAYYSTFSGILKSIDAADNRSAGVAFSTGTRANPLAAITPVFTAVAISNGYTVSFPFPAEAEYGEIYQKYTSWSGTTSYYDSFTGTRSAGGLSGTNTLTLSSVIDNHGITITTLPVGYRVTGTGIPDNTYITSVTGTQMTVNKNFTSNVTGVVSGYALVYGGIGPATISSTIYEPTYLVMKFYDAFGNESLVSAEQIVTPINPAVVDVTVPTAPTVNTISTTSNTASITITTTDPTTKGYKLRYKRNIDSLYTTVDVAPIASFISGTSTTSYTIGGLLPATLYDISAAGYNQYNGVGVYSANDAATTSVQSVSVVTGLTLTNEIYGINARWAAPATPTYPIAYYKAELYNNAAPTVVVLTDNTYSLSYDFINLTSGTTYFVKVYAIDIYGGISSAVTSSTLVVIPLSSTQALNILTNQLFAIGGSGGSYNIALDGTGNGTTTPYKLYSGTGTYGTTATGFYLDSTGKFSLKDKLTFDGTTLAVNGAITAQSGNFAGAMTVNNGTMKIGTDAGGTGNHGIYINGSNSWYSNGNFSVGATNNTVTYDGITLAVTGAITARSGSIIGNLSLGGSLYSNTIKSVSITGITPNATTGALYAAVGHTFVAGDVVVISGVAPYQYAGIFTVSSVVTNVSFTVLSNLNTTAVTTATGTAVSGSVQSFVLNKGGITFNSPTTQGVTSIDGATGSLTTISANIAGWTIDSSKIEKLTNSTYSGMSSTGTYAFYAGGISGNSNANAPFSVTQAGAVVASNIKISGGNLDIGGTSISTTATGTSGQSTVVVNSFTGITSGMLVFGTGIANGTTVSVTPTTTTVTLSAANTGTVSGNVYFVSASGAHITSAGDLYAANANLQGRITAASGSITGNLIIGSLGALTSGVVGQGSGNAGYILNTAGLRFDTGTTQGITQIIGATGQLITTSALIGGWTVNNNSISRSGALGTSGNISLNSSGNISVSAANVAGYTSGINGPFISSGTELSDNINGTSVGSENVFWAGTGGATGTSNVFRVTLSGNLYASNAKITGTVSSVGSGGTMIMDGVSGHISLKPSGATTGTSYLVPRNDNIYLTSPSANGPWSNPTNKTIDVSTGPVDGPYLSAGSKFRDPWNNEVSAIGMYTGSWNYFATPFTSNPFITATRNAAGTKGTIQLSASPQIGILVENGGVGGIDPFTDPTILIYTANNSSAPTSPNYSPSTVYGAWAKFTANNIRLSASTTSYIDLNGITGSQKITIQGGTSYGEFSSTGIVLLASTLADSGDRASAYSSGSKIVLNPINDGVNIFGLPMQGDVDLRRWPDAVGPKAGSITPYIGETYYNGTTLTTGNGVLSVVGNGAYRNATPLGPYARQRMLVEDPVTGMTSVGMGIYYVALTDFTGTPTSGTGVAGDLLVQY